MMPQMPLSDTGGGVPLRLQMVRDRVFLGVQTVIAFGKQDVTMANTPLKFGIEPFSAND